MLSGPRHGRKADPSSFLSALGHAQKHLVLGVLGRPIGQDISKEAVSEFLSLHPGKREMLIENFISLAWSGKGWRAVGEPERARDGLRSMLPASTAIDTATVALIRRKLNELAEDGQERHLRLWVGQGEGALVLGQILYKHQYIRDPQYDGAELSFMRDLFGEDIERWSPERYAKELHHALARKLDSGRVTPLARAAFEARGCDLHSLRRSARRQREYFTLLDALGLPPERRRVLLDEDAGSSVASPDHENQDRLLSLTMEGKERIHVRAVFDGVGGHGDGSLASSAARDTIEIFARAGWIRGPEDVRRALATADMIIFNESYNQARMQGKELEEGGLSMSTAAVALIAGGDLYAIHCGDSQVALAGSEGLRFSTLPHVLSDDFEMQRMLAKRGKDAGESGKRLTSTLGGLARRISINNNDAHERYSPLRVADGAAVLVTSDGVSDELDAESLSTLTLLFGRSEAALSRAIVRSSAPPEGKSGDDRSACVFIAPGRERSLSEEEGIEDLERLVASDPQGAMRDERVSRLVRRCLDDSTSAARVLDTFGRLIDAAQASADGDGRARFNESARAIFHVLSSRKDRPALDRALEPAIRGWTPRLVSILTNAQEAHPYLETMLSYLEAYGDRKQMAPLLFASAPPVREKAMRLSRIPIHRPDAMRLLTDLRPKILEKPDRGLLDLPGYRKVVAYLADSKTNESDFLEVMGELIAIFEDVPGGNGNEGKDVLLSSIFSALSMRPDKEDLLELLQSSERFGEWTEFLVKKLSIDTTSDSKAMGPKRLMFDFVQRRSDPSELAPLERASMPEVQKWAEEAITGRLSKPSSQRPGKPSS